MVFVVRFLTVMLMSLSLLISLLICCFLLMRMVILTTAGFTCQALLIKRIQPAVSLTLALSQSNVQQMASLLSMTLNLRRPW